MIGGCPPLHHAVRSGHVDSVRIILDAGADVDMADSNGFTALHVAARAGQSDVVDCLVNEYRADKNILDSGGKTAWYWAKEEGHHNIMERLPEFKYNWATQVLHDCAATDPRIIV